VDNGVDAVKESAAIWARAKARRDEDPEPATVEESGPGIQRRLSIEGAELLLARKDGQPVGFALVAPSEQTLELFYLGVDPDAWGAGVGSLLLRSVEERARDRSGHVPPAYPLGPDTPSQALRASRAKDSRKIEESIQPTTADRLSHHSTTYPKGSK
jgi:GNAT superfamily N-acetyltransferase